MLFRKIGHITGHSAHPLLQLSALPARVYDCLPPSRPVIVNCCETKIYGLCHLALLCVRVCLCVFLSLPAYAPACACLYVCELGVLRYRSMFSGCTDDQESSDLCEASSMGAGGACTNALVDTLVSRSYSCLQPGDTTVVRWLCDASRVYTTPIFSKQRTLRFIRVRRNILNRTYSTQKNLHT